MKHLLVIFFRYLLIFLLFAVITSLFYIPIYRYILKFVTNNEYSHIESRLKSGTETIDSTIINIKNTVRGINSDPRFRVLFYAPSSDINPYTLIRLKESLNGFMASNDLILDAGFLFNPEMAITRHGIYAYPPSESFYGDSLICGDHNYEEWIEMLVKNKPFIPIQLYESYRYGTYKALTYCYQWSYAEDKNSKLIFAILPIEKILSLIAEDDIIENAFVSIKNGDKVLFSNNIIREKEEMVLRAANSDNTISFEIGVSPNFLKQRISAFMRLIFVFASVFIITIITLSTLFAYYNVKSIQKFLFRIDQNETMLKNSLRAIDQEKEIIKKSIINKIKENLEKGDHTASIILLQESILPFMESEEVQMQGLMAEMFQNMIAEIKEKYPIFLENVEAPVYDPLNRDNFFMIALPLCFKEICQLCKKNLFKSLSEFDIAILEYINSHLYDPGLYITMVTEHFKISAPTVQHIIKTATGETFLAYVKSRRLAQSCELLNARTDSVSKIALACGFSNANSFTRAFKEVYGFPPSKLSSNLKPPSGGGSGGIAVPTHPMSRYAARGQLPDLKKFQGTEP